jgi:hypothetical protein
MSASRNPDALFGQGPFKSRVPPSEPMTTKGHKPYIKTGKEKVPEYHAEKYPPGTAPREHTFEPRPEGEVPAQAYDATPNAADTLPGVTSKDVYRGEGKPLQGMERRELRGAHPRKRKKERAGVAARGGSEGVDIGRLKGGDLPEGVEKGTRGKHRPDWPGAEDRPPASAEEVASEL